MGLETLAGFRESINHALGQKRQGNERLDRWINEGHIELFGELDIQGRRTCGVTDTVVDQREYSVPPDLLATLVLRDLTNNRRLIRTSIENFKLFDEGTEGNPTHYMRVDDLLFIFPRPNAVVTIQMFYVKEPGVLAEGTDNSELPLMYYRIIDLIGLRNALVDLGDRDRATLIANFTTAQLRSLPTEEWLESQKPQEGIQIARSFRDLQKDPRQGTDETFRGRILL